VAIVVSTHALHPDAAALASRASGALPRNLVDPQAVAHYRTRFRPVEPAA